MKTKDARLRRAGGSGDNKQKRTPGHTKKSTIVVDKEGMKINTIRFSERSVETAGTPNTGEQNTTNNKKESFKAKHETSIAEGQKAATYCTNKKKW